MLRHMSEFGPEIERCPAYDKDYRKKGLYESKHYASSDTALYASFYASPSFSLTPADMGEGYIDCETNQATLENTANRNGALLKHFVKIEEDLVDFGKTVFEYLDTHPDVQNAARRIASIRGYGKTIPEDDHAERQHYGEQVYALLASQHELEEMSEQLDDFFEEMDELAGKATSLALEVTQAHQKSAHPSSLWTYPEA